jgi:hypothetical protein
MIERNSALRHLGLFLFLGAIILGVLLSLVRAIPDLEATMYGFTKYGYPHISSLSCPLLMTTADREAVTVKLQNKLEKPLAWYFVAEFSSHVMINSVNGNVELQPGETRLLSWEVNQGNISMGNFILARVFTSAATAHGMNEGFCGTYVIDLPITGGPTIYYLAIAITVLCLGVGLWLWRRYTLLSESTLVSQFTWMRFAALLVILGVAAGYFNSWFLTIACVFLTVLTTVVFMVYRKN